MKKAKYIIAALLCCMLMVSSISADCFAQTDAAFSQEKAIAKVKSIYDTSAYDEFNINYVEEREGRWWDLSWTKSEEPFGHLNISIDADSGVIRDIYKWDDSNHGPSLIPKVSEADARKTAESFAKKLQPEEFKQCRYQEPREDYIYPIEGVRFKDSYRFNFMRFYNDIPVEDNGFDITINAQTGDIQYYRFNWTKDKLPSSDKIISLKEAEKAFKDKAGLKLEYRRYFNYQTKEAKIKLVYSVADGHSVLIDATNGELLNEMYYDLYNDYSGGGSDREAIKSTPQEQLSPHEQKEVEATKNCITKEAAISAVKKYFDIPQGFKQSYANLYEDYDNTNQRAWNISWNKQDKDNYGSISARVNATTSEVLSFNIYDEDMGRSNFKQNYDRKKAQKKAEQFLEKIQPERINEVKLEEFNAKIDNPEKIREHSFCFTRYINDIPCHSNGFDITIDAESGKVLNYRMRWNDGEFPKADGILQKEEAEKAFLEKLGLELSYVKIYEPKGQTYEYCLVYKLKPAQSYTFDSFDLKPLDYSGKPIEEKPQTAFSDIKGHWAENDIQLLVDLGVIQSQDENFYPNENISQGYFIKLLMIATNRQPVLDEVALKYGMTQDTDIDKYIEAAIKNGIVKEGEVNPQKPLTKEMAAAFMVRSLGFEKIASLSDIFNVKAKDASAISAKYKGHAAISIGLGLIKGDGTNFNPKANVSRAQAASLLVRMLKADVR